MVEIQAKTECSLFPSVPDTSAAIDREMLPLLFAIKEVGNHFLLPPISYFAYYR